MFGRKPKNQPSTYRPTLDISGRRRKRFKAFLWGLILLIFGVAAWVGITGAIAYRNITAKNSNDAPSFFRYGGNIPPDQLKGEGDGRVNILAIGIGGSNHPGGLLADTIQIISIDPINKSMAMISVPRDLYVDNPSGGKSKINAVYANAVDKCGSSSYCKESDPGADALKKVITNVIGEPVHYFIRLDFKGFEQMIDAIGGVKVNVEKPLNDPLFPDDQLKGYSPLYIPAGLQTFDGKKALKYARSRETTSDFDRSRRQQQIINAAKEKVLAANTLANPKKVTDLFNILGNHLRTDFKIDEIVRLYALSKDIKAESITTTVLDTSAASPLRSTNDPKAGYIIYPRLGQNDYSDVRLFIQSILKEPYLIKENAKIRLVDATGKAKIIAEVEKRLKSLGYNVVVSQKADKTQTFSSITYFSDKPYTVSLLKKRFTTGAEKGKESQKVGGEDVTLTIGSSYKLP